MDHLFGKHIQITKPLSQDGTSPYFDEETGVKVEKVTPHPYSEANLKIFEDRNTRLPTALKMKIEVIGGTGNKKTK